MTDTLTIDKWLLATLTGDSLLVAELGTRWYEDMAPQDAEFPLGIYSLNSSQNENALDGADSLAKAMYVVKAVGKRGGVGSLKAAAERIDVLLAGVIATQDGLRLRWQREQSVKYPELEGGVRYHHLGGIYRCWVS